MKEQQMYMRKKLVLFTATFLNTVFLFPWIARRQRATAPKRHGFLPEPCGHSLRLLGAAHGSLKPDVWQQQGKWAGNMGSQQEVAGTDSECRRSFSLSISSVAELGKESRASHYAPVTHIVTYSQIRSGYSSLHPRSFRYFKRRYVFMGKSSLNRYVEGIPSFLIFVYSQWLLKAEKASICYWFLHP